MPGETQGRFYPRSSVSSEALNRLASTVESTTQVESPGLYRDTGGVSRLDFGDMFLVEITGFKSGTPQEGEPKLYSWRAVQYDQDNALADTDPPLEGTVGTTDTNPGVQFGEYTYDRPAIGCLALLRQGYYDKYDIVMWTANRDVMVFKASDATYGTRSCTGTPQVYATGTGWIDAPWASVAHWELVTEVGYAYPVNDRFYIGRRIEQRRSSGEHSDEPIYKYIIWPGGLSISSSSYEVSGTPTNLPHTPSTYGVSDLIFSEDFYWVGQLGTPPADRHKIGIYTADRHRPGIITANYLGAEGSPGYTPRFPNSVELGYQWLGEDTKCFGAVFAETQVRIGSYLTSVAGLSPPYNAHGTWSSYNPYNGIPGILAAGGMVLSFSSSVAPTYGHEVRGRISCGSLDIVVTGDDAGAGAADGSTMRVGYISNPSVYSASGSSSTITKSAVSFTDMGMFMNGGPGVFMNCCVEIGQNLTSGRSSGTGCDASGLPTHAAAYGNSSNATGLHLNQNTASRFSGAVVVAGSVVDNTTADSYPSGTGGTWNQMAYLKIGNYYNFFGTTSQNRGELRISRSGKIVCEHTEFLVRTGGSGADEYGATDSAMGFHFVNGWCTQVPSIVGMVTGAMVVFDGTSMVTSDVAREESGQFQSGAGTDRWVAYSSASI